VVQSCKDQDGVGISIVLNQSHEISSPKLLTSQGKDIIGGIQSRFVYQSTSLDYYQPVEDWEVEENTNINVLKEAKENYLRSY
jgi:hypothetical protein